MKGSRSQKATTIKSQRVAVNTSKRTASSASARLSPLSSLRISPGVAAGPSSVVAAGDFSSRSLATASTRQRNAVLSPLTMSNRGFIGGVANKIARRVLIQYGNLPYIDRQQERDLLLPKEAVELANRPKRAARGHPEFDFDTAYYKRVNLVPPAYNPAFPEDPLVLVKDKPMPVSSPAHLPHSFTTYQPEYDDHATHVFTATGHLPHLARVPKNPNEFTVLGLDSDYLYFHD